MTAILEQRRERPSADAHRALVAPLFCPGGETPATLAAFATFAVGCIARRLGGLIIGHVGDHYGRRPALLLTVMVMGVATAGIGLSGATTLVAEFVPQNGVDCSPHSSWAGLRPVSPWRHWRSWRSRLSDQALLAWAWRLPFLVSVVLFALAVFIRQRLEDRPEYLEARDRTEERADRQRVPVSRLFRHHLHGLITGFLMMTGHNAINYTLAVFAISPMTFEHVGLSRPAARGAMIGSVTAFAILLGLASGSAWLAVLAVTTSDGLVITFTSGGQGAFLTGCCLLSLVAVVFAPRAQH
ncbi:hypothetical protein [Auritidibacter sp. NML100628]|uniref:hypothetical protein n=1 Tax=Auritidibacter sp. NML100628 TaxID=2170742 RepID=UPI000D734E1B|nr:hypothetical protein [Auritidibacter sp. NML100628]PXA78412.1 hypothetical protein DCC24_01680 [Auritidibacter sp. NML100628]